MNSRKIVDKILSTLVIIVMSVLVLDVVWNVASRYLLNAPSSFSVELARYLLIWVGMLGAAYTSGKKEHIAIELLPQKLQRKNPAKKRKLDNIINTLIILFALFVLVIGGIRLVYITMIMEQVSATLQIPLWYVYLCLPISGILIMFYSINEMVYGIPHELRKDYLD